MTSSLRVRRTTMLALIVALLAALSATASPQADAADDEISVFDYWTPARMANAIPRDLVVDERGLGYLRLPDGTLRPYGHATPQLRAVPSVKPDNPGGGGGGGGNDTTGPDISNLDPNGSTIGESYTFSATVTDTGSGVKSVKFIVIYPDGSTTQSFNASDTGGDVWAVTLSGFTNGEWSWYVEAKDNAKKGGNTTVSDPPAPFTVDTGTSDGGGDGGGTGDGTVTNAEWAFGGDVQWAAGRIYFEMPYRGPFWSGYVCSGTAATDAENNDVSIIITAAHCVYDDANKVFARNVLFIPNQAETTGSGTDTNCDNDPIGCWAPSHGVVDDDWANRTWPDNIPWDYAYYVVALSGAHQGNGATSDTLEAAVPTLGIQFTAATQGVFTHALGYSYDQDPKFMYCAEGLGTDSSWNTHWLGSCELSGGSSGGPWVQPMDTSTGNGPIIAVNSYGYSNQPGMGAARLTGSASCVLGEAEKNYTTTTGGAIVTCPAG